MIRRPQRERSSFEVLLPDGHKLWADWLRKIDTLLGDEAVIETVAQRWRRAGLRAAIAAGSGHPRKSSRGC